MCGHLYEEVRNRGIPWFTPDPHMESREWAYQKVEQDAEGSHPGVFFVCFSIEHSHGEWGPLNRNSKTGVGFCRFCKGRGIQKIFSSRGGRGTWHCMSIRDSSRPLSPPQDLDGR